MMNSAGRTTAMPISTIIRPSRMSCAVIVVPRPHADEERVLRASAPASAPSRHFCVEVVLDHAAHLDPGVGVVGLEHRPVGRLLAPTPRPC